MIAEMVLFHAVFVALKSRCPLTINRHPDDFKLASENRLFQGLFTFLLLEGLRLSSVAVLIEAIAKSSMTGSNTR